MLAEPTDASLLRRAQTNGSSRINELVVALAGGLDGAGRPTLL